jgi:hypothetical protein
MNAWHIGLLHSLCLTDYHVVQVHKSAFINGCAMWLKHMCTFYLIVNFAVLWLFDRTAVPSRMQKVSESENGSCVMGICFCTLEELHCKTLATRPNMHIDWDLGVGATCTCVQFMVFIGELGVSHIPLLGWIAIFMCIKEHVVRVAIRTMGGNDTTPFSCVVWIICVHSKHFCY